MVKGQLHALPVVALAASASQASSSVSAGSAMEAVNVAATFAAAQQKLNRTYFNDWLPSSTPPSESCPWRGRGRRFLRGTSRRRALVFAQCAEAYFISYDELHQL